MAGSRQPTGKIARLPHVLREEVNRRLLDGETTAQVLEWLNAEPEAIKVWARHFEEMPANAENLSKWRQAGYQKWLERHERVENLKTLSRFAHDLAKNSGGLADGAAAILGGQILEALEVAGNVAITGGNSGASADDKDSAEKDPADGLAKIAGAVAALQKGTIAREKLELDKRKTRLAEKGHTLNVEKFETGTVEKFMEFAKTPEARSILDSGKPKSTQVAELRRLMFGDRSKTAPQPVTPLSPAP